MAVVLIRDARPDEFDALGEVRVAAYLADGFLSPTSMYAPRLRALGADGSGLVLVATDGGDKPDDGDAGAIIGTVMLQVWPDGGEFLRESGEAEIRALAVLPAARGAGLGRLLLTAITDLARSIGVRNLLLLTQPEMKAAHHLYEQAGFARLPDRDLIPVPEVLLLAYGLGLDGVR
jgi:ribosomal protein S18 acetylase RimI-like enzyme